MGGSCGTIFELTPPRKGVSDWIETQLYVFKGGQDGALPTSGLVFDQSGSLYGVTAYGGTGSCTLGQDRVGCGTIFQMAPPKHVGGAWTEKIIYSFKGDKDGYHPAGDLIFDSAGKLYGSTTFGGISSNYCNEFYPGCGTVFELRPSHAKGGGWDERVIYTFQSGTDGAGPVGGLTLDSNHNLYGATNSGGDPSCGTGGLGCGTVFRLTSPNQRVLGLWNGQKRGLSCIAGVVRDQRGNLKHNHSGRSRGNGCCLRGLAAGVEGWGTVFEIRSCTATWVVCAERTWSDGEPHVRRGGWRFTVRYCPRWPIG